MPANWKSWAANIVTGLVLVAAMASAAAAWWPRMKAPAKRTYALIESAVGDTLPGIRIRTGDSTRLVSFNDRPHIIYYFRTTCMYCEMQKDRIRDFLLAFDAASVTTVSSEPDSITASYWGGSALPRPRSAPSAQWRALGITGTPTLIFIKPNGVVASAYSGLLGDDWDAARMRAEFTAAGASR